MTAYGPDGMELVDPPDIDPAALGDLLRQVGHRLRLEPGEDLVALEHAFAAAEEKKTQD
jgi:hypothetical protein